jgi:hypothetical protein
MPDIDPTPNEEEENRPEPDPDQQSEALDSMLEGTEPGQGSSQGNDDSFNYSEVQPEEETEDEAEEKASASDIISELAGGGEAETSSPSRQVEIEKNEHHVSVEEVMKREGYEDEEAFIADLLQELTAERRTGVPATCDLGCNVEVDGKCPHGQPSVLMASPFVTV